MLSLPYAPLPVLPLAKQGEGGAVKRALIIIV